MHDDPRDAELEHDADFAEDLDAQALIAAAVAEARRYVRRNELRTNSALDAISDWIEKSEMRHADEAKRLSSSQERVASAMRDALDLMTGRLNHIEKLVAEAPVKAFVPIRDALGRLDERISVMESQHSADERNSQEISSHQELASLQEFSSLMESLGQRVAGVVEKIDELADARDNPTIRGERIASIEAKLGSILQQLSRPTATGEKSASASASRPAAAPTASAPAGAQVAGVRSTGGLDASAEDANRRQEMPGGQPFPARPSGPTEANASIANLRAELGALAAQLQRLEKGQVDPRVLSELLSTASEVRRLLADPAMPRLAAAIEQGVAALTRRIDALTTKLADRDEVAALTGALREINAKLSRPSSSDGVERRIEALSAKIDQVMREPLTLVGRHLADLSSRLPAAGNGAVSNAVAAQTSALAKISERLDKVSAKLDQAPRGMDGTALNELHARLHDVAQSVERSAAKTPEALDRLLRQVVASLQGTKQADPALSAVQALERQIAALAERLGDPQSASAINALGRSIAKLSDDLAETRTAAMKAAQAAASDAAAQATSASHQQRVPAERELHSTLLDMNGTLERIMGSLANLEGEARPASVARFSSASERPAETAPAWDQTEAEDLGPERGEEGFHAKEPGEAQAEVGAFEAAALEAARNAAERAAQRESGMPAAPAQPAPGDEPLEPGSGRPPVSPPTLPNRAIDELILGSSGDPRTPTSEKAGSSGSGSAMSAQALIAAARRAAAQSAAGATSNTSSAHGGSGGAPLSLGGGVKRKPILLALIGLIAAFSAVGAGRLLLGNWPLSLDRPELPLSHLVPQSERSSGLPPRASAALAKLKQVLAAHRGKEDLSKPANDVTGSIAAASIPARDAAPAPSKPTETGVTTATQSPGAASGGDIVTRLKGAANADDPIAEYELASRLYDGNGLPRDQQAAAKLFLRAANQGLAPAQYRIANIYETGTGMPQDLSSARTWAEKAADRGNVKAMHNVGVYLAQGIQGKPDYATAATWFRKAAERDLRDSQFNLGVLIVRGLGTPKDYKTAYFWLALAARAGDTESAAKRDEVGRYLTNAELDEAKMMVANFKPVEIDHAANDVDLKDIKWERVTPAANEADAAKTKKL
jgi:localization factor PodJL